jgi:hypothetical protein
MGMYPSLLRYIRVGKDGHVSILKDGHVSIPIKIYKSWKK